MSKLIHWEDPAITAAITPDISRLYMDFTYWSERLDGKHTIKAPFDFDWDSVKRWKLVFYWWLKGRAKIAALIHDELYRYARFSGRPITRKEADLVFLDAMVEEMRRAREYKELRGLRLRLAEARDATRRQAIYRGVRIGGWKGWNDYRAAELSA